MEVSTAEVNSDYMDGVHMAPIAPPQRRFPPATTGASESDITPSEYR